MLPIPPWLPILLGFLQAVGPISTDMYLPAFPAIETSLHAQPGSAQLTLGSWIMGISAGQLIQGALADRFGRRSPLLVGTLIYTIGSVACALSGSIGVMSVWRFVAATGASASMVIPRAVVRDITHGHDQARLMSRLILILGAAPILAPTLGGLVLQWSSWRGIFWINAGYGLLALVAAAVKLPDTLPLADRMTLHPITMFHRYKHIFTERAFLTHALMMSFYTFSLCAYLGGSPTVFIDHYHFSPTQYALAFGGVAAVYIVASQLNMKLVRRWDIDGTLRRVSSCYLVMAVIMLFCAIIDVPAWVFMIVLALTHGINGFLSPTAIVGALRHHAARAGSASALMGTRQFFIGASGGFIVGWLTNGTAVPMVALMVCGAVAAKIADLCRPREGRGPVPPSREEALTALETTV
jgi:DHA1 family bicyclomycin/chloramphenicol resistance-like MFS transporter